MFKRNATGIDVPSLPALPSSKPGRTVPFLLGMSLGSSLGLLVGVLVGKQITHLLAMLISTVDRRVTGGDDERLKFELLLQ